ncbi:MAG: exosortase [Cytophagales bacterium]|nr:exosortase [Armatimonadota bacterium]
MPDTTTVASPSAYPAAPTATGFLGAGSREVEARGTFAGAYGPLLLPLALFAALLGVIALPMLRWWYWEYTKPESYYGYAFFVPPLIGVMLWHKRKALAEATPTPYLPALIIVIPALSLLVLAIKTEMQAVMSSAFLLTFTSGLWLALGTRWVRAAAFPLLFLWLMAPLPGPVLNDLTLSAQRISTEGAARLLGLLALHPVHDGNLIHLENYTLNVDVPCSGFKLLLSLLTFSAAFAFLTDTTLAKRWGLFLLSLPLTILVNSVRIALIGIVGEALGSSAANTFHDWSGVISLVLCMVLLFSGAKGLGCRTFAGQPIF